MKLKEIGEFGWIERLSTRLARRGGVQLGIGDDAAVLNSLRVPVVTTDALTEGVHFRRDWTSPRALGRKAMAVNVSDIAAMGARPIAAFVALSVSTHLAEESDALEWLDELYAGFEDAAHEYQFTLAGGDTTRAPHDVVISVAMIGDCETNGQASTPVLRSGAKAGDAVIMTGTVGDAAAGLFLLQHLQLVDDEKLDAVAREYLLRRHFEPSARLLEMRAALSVADGGERVVSAALDLSDGLAGDALHVAHRSNVALEIEVARLPISEYSRALAHAAQAIGFEASAEDWALCGGEDYELLLCVKSESAAAVCAAITEATSTPARVIGRCLPHDRAAPIILVHGDGRREIASGAWRHY